MKANEAPEKIYIQPNAHDGWFVTNNLNASLIEYIRADAFIEKACFYIKNMVLDITYSDVDGKDNYDIDKFIDDFKKVMAI